MKSTKISSVLALMIMISFLAHGNKRYEITNIKIDSSSRWNTTQYLKVRDKVKAYGFANEGNNGIIEVALLDHAILKLVEDEEHTVLTFTDHKHSIVINGFDPDKVGQINYQYDYKVFENNKFDNVYFDQLSPDKLIEAIAFGEQFLETYSKKDFVRSLPVAEDPNYTKIQELGKVLVKNSNAIIHSEEVYLEKEGAVIEKTYVYEDEENEIRIFEDPLHHQIHISYSSDSSGKYYELTFNEDRQLLDGLDKTTLKLVDAKKLSMFLDDIKNISKHQLTNKE